MIKRSLCLLLCLLLCLSVFACVPKEKEGDLQPPEIKAPVVTLAPGDTQKYTLKWVSRITPNANKALDLFHAGKVNAAYALWEQQALAGNYGAMALAALTAKALEDKAIPGKAPAIKSEFWVKWLVHLWGPSTGYALLGNMAWELIDEDAGIHSADYNTMEATATTGNTPSDYFSKPDYFNTLALRYFVASVKGTALAYPDVLYNISCLESVHTGDYQRQFKYNKPFPIVPARFLPATGEEARYWLGRASEKNNYRALAQSGYAYRGDFSHGSKNLELAVRYLERAARNGAVYVAVDLTNEYFNLATSLELPLNCTKGFTYMATAMQFASNGTLKNYGEYGDLAKTLTDNWIKTMLEGSAEKPAQCYDDDYNKGKAEGRKIYLAFIKQQSEYALHIKQQDATIKALLLPVFQEAYKTKALPK